MPKVEKTVRTYVQLAGTQQMLYCSDSYNEICDRVEAARHALIGISEESMGNPLSSPLVNVRMLVGIDDEQSMVDACFNPMHVLLIYRAHPDV